MAVPCIDFNSIAATVPDDAITEDVLRSVGRHLADAFTEVGFCCIQHHGVPKDLMDACLDFSQRFFALSIDVKREFLRPDGVTDFRGWMPLPNTPGFGKKPESFDSSALPDYKETYNVKINAPDSLYPSGENMKGMRNAAQQLMTTYDVLLRRIMLALGHGLELADPRALLNHLQFKGTDSDMSEVRFALYPKKDINQFEENQQRCGEHTDLGILAFLFQNEVPGLQIFTRKEEYVEVQPCDGTILVNVGDSLERLTGGILLSAKHKVIFNKTLATQDRYSINYFAYADLHTSLEAVCGDRERYGEKIKCVDFLKRRYEDVFERNVGVVKHTTN